MELGSATLGRVSSERRASSPAHIYSVTDRPLFPICMLSPKVCVNIRDSISQNTITLHDVSNKGCLGLLPKLRNALNVLTQRAYRSHA